MRHDDRQGRIVSLTELEGIISEYDKDGDAKIDKASAARHGTVTVKSRYQGLGVIFDRDADIEQMVAESRPSRSRCYHGKVTVLSRHGGTGSGSRYLALRPCHGFTRRCSLLSLSPSPSLNVLSYLSRPLSLSPSPPSLLSRGSPC